MYQQNILDHYKYPRNFGPLLGAQHHAHVANPLCGDELDFFLKFDEQEKIAAVKFTGQGCTISIASASMLSEKIKGLSRAESEKLTKDDVLKLLGVEVNPARLRCATLSLEAVQQALGHH
ncbi:MAG: iron-sulfur cluster assembly scaffold protein [Candidatus Kerfeldbacteria bacterium]|nr:iron-sulfur cluster assembly scaffold protein [Candidatus Kerfeldbacteria bacterium]